MWTPGGGAGRAGIVFATLQRRGRVRCHPLRPARQVTRSFLNALRSRIAGGLHRALGIRPGRAGPHDGYYTYMQQGQPCAGGVPPTGGPRLLRAARQGAPRRCCVIWPCLPHPTTRSPLRLSAHASSPRCNTCCLQPVARQATWACGTARCCAGVLERRHPRAALRRGSGAGGRAGWPRVDGLRRDAQPRRGAQPAAGMDPGHAGVAHQCTCRLRACPCWCLAGQCTPRGSPGRDRRLRTGRPRSRQGDGARAQRGAWVGRLEPGAGSGCGRAAGRGRRERWAAAAHPPAAPMHIMRSRAFEMQAADGRGWEEGWHPGLRAATGRRAGRRCWLAGLAVWLLPALRYSLP